MVAVSTWMARLNWVMVCYDATQSHDVDPIVALDEGPQLGRMQMFAIPTLLKLPYENDRIIDKTPLAAS